MTHHSSNSVRDHMKWAGLLGCEAVLSSMALMQANNIPGQKKMMSPLGQGQRTSPESHQTHSQHSQNHHSHQVHHGQAHHSHMGHPSTGSCPPLLIRKDGDYHTSRIIEGKGMQANQNMQPKKKHKKSGLANKVKVEHLVPSVDMDDDSSLKVQKNFICDHCYGAFRSSYHLKRHILTHTGEKPFACDACDMRFIQRYHLDRHKRVHSGEKPYQCDRCHQVIHTFYFSLIYFTCTVLGTDPALRDFQLVTITPTTMDCRCIGDMALHVPAVLKQKRIQKTNLEIF
uniref:Zinc finger protein 740b n=1 Tax=Oreochromis niloticus TaxID=8128 RepID=A0A669ETR4_ORENI